MKWPNYYVSTSSNPQQLCKGSGVWSIYENAESSDLQKLQPMLSGLQKYVKESTLAEQTVYYSDHFL